MHKQELHFQLWLINNYSSSPNGLLSQQPIQPSAMRARGIIVLVKSTSWSKIWRQNNYSQLKLDFNPFLPPKSRRFSLLVSYNIQPSSSSTNQNAALIIDHQLDFTKYTYSKVVRENNRNVVPGVVEGKQQKCGGGGGRLSKKIFWWQKEPVCLHPSYHVQFSLQESVNRNHDYKLSTMDNDSGGKLIVYGYFTAE